MGIIGKTHGVNNAANPAKNAIKKIKKITTLNKYIRKITTSKGDVDIWIELKQKILGLKEREQEIAVIAQTQGSGMAAAAKMADIQKKNASAFEPELVGPDPTRTLTRTLALRIASGRGDMARLFANLNPNPH